MSRSSASKIMDCRSQVQLGNEDGGKNATVMNAGYLGERFRDGVGEEFAAGGEDEVAVRFAQQA